MTPEQIYEVKELIRNVGSRLDIYIKEDTQWKEDAAPVIKMGKNLNGFSAVVKWLFIVAAAIGSIWGGVEYIANFIVKHK